MILRINAILRIRSGRIPNGCFCRILRNHLREKRIRINICLRNHNWYVLQKMRWPIRLLHLRYFCSCPNLNLFGQGHQLQIDGRPANNHPNLHVVHTRTKPAHCVCQGMCDCNSERTEACSALVCNLCESSWTASFLWKPYCIYQIPYRMNRVWILSQRFWILLLLSNRKIKPWLTVLE